MSICCSSSQGESGRSLTEMMATLAIMGILSIAGIWMYNSAMNSHRANELIYEAQKRATTVAMQITAGHESLSVAEFPDPEGYTFGVEKNSLNANQFNITLTGVNANVCQKMKAAVDPSSSVRVISEFCDTLTFNNDLSTRAYASDAQTATDCTGLGTWCSSGDNGAGAKCSENTNCCTGIVYDTQCQTCTSTSGTIKNAANTTPCDFDGDGVNDSYCNTGVCVNPNMTNGATCTSNADCGGIGSGYYCKIDYTAENNLTIASPNFTETECYKNLTGTCTVMPRPTRLTVTQENLLRRAGFAATIVFGPNVNWWSANNWCLAQGKHLIDVSQMDCHRKTNVAATNNTIVQTGETWAYCCKDGQACQQGSWNASLWSGKTILEGKEDEVAKFSDKMVALRKVFGARYFWTASPYSNTSSNSCMMFFISCTNSFVNNNKRNDNNYTLCE